MRLARERDVLLRVLSERRQGLFRCIQLAVLELAVEQGGGGEEVGRVEFDGALKVRFGARTVAQPQFYVAEVTEGHRVHGSQPGHLLSRFERFLE